MYMFDGVSTYSWQTTDFDFKTHHNPTAQDLIQNSQPLLILRVAPVPCSGS